MAAFDIFTNDDLNGECFIIGSEGELDVNRNECKYALLAGDNVGHNDAHNNAWYTRFIADQVDYLQANIQPHDANLTDAIIAQVAYIRALAIKMNLIDLNVPAAQHHCIHTDRVNIAGHAAYADADILALNALLPADVRLSLREKFTNMVCAVAYIFRIRGHHYMDGFDAKYSGIWRRSLYNEDDPGLPWKYIAVHALHAIYPDDLDAFWVNAAQTATCSGTLQKRVNCAPAGVAGIFALKKGMDDLLTAFPQIRVTQHEAIDHLDGLYLEVIGHRWRGSVNRRYYNEVDLYFDEARVSSLAALVMGALKNFNPSAPLAQSYALKRIAGNAPIVSGVMEEVLDKAASRDEMVQSVVPLQLPRS